MLDTVESAKLKSILFIIKEEAEFKLRRADDMKTVHQAQAKIDVVETITTQFFTEKKPPTHEHSTLRI